MERGGGTATFVLGDIVGSTRMWADVADAMPEALDVLDGLVRGGIERHGGERPPEQGEGDNFFVVFPVASAAVAFALDLQRELRARGELTMRMGIHTGDALRREDGRWMGHAVHRAARVRDVAHGGQILVSGATAELVVETLPDGAWLKDLGSHRLKDLARSEYIRQLCHPDLEGDFPPLRSLDKLPHNLPVELDSFVGREAELATIDDLLCKARMVTLTGAGGAGKTRLAIHAAAARIESMPDGVWLADLAPIVDPSLVPKVLARAMHLAEQPLQPIADTVVARLCDASSLVILDNCEHLLEATSTVAERLLRECPGVVILATSREPLGVEGEVVYGVPSMALPSSDEDATCESVRLFEERAKSVRPTFALDTTTMPAVASLCRRLDGLPLAVELAAARCRAMSPMEISSQLDKAMDVLTAGRRGLLPRQRTLEGCVEWSYDLLSEEERRFLSRLSVFAGGFDLSGAERVGSGEGVDEWRVVDLLTSLVDKSLVQAEESEGRTRYRLLETIRIFAVRRLADAGELAPARDRHLAHFTSLAESFHADLTERGTADTFARLRGEADNFRAAIDWAIASEQIDAAWRMISDAYAFLSSELFEELRERIHELSLAGGGSRADRVVVLCAVSMADWSCGDPTRAATHLEEATRCAGDDGALVARVYKAKAWLALFRRDPAALELIDHVFPTPEGVPLGMSIDSLVCRSYCALLTGNLNDAVDDATRALGLATDARNELGEARALSWLAFVHVIRGSAREAAAAVAGMERLRWQGLRDPMVTGFTTIVPVSLASCEGRHEEALRSVDEALAEARRYRIMTALAQGSLVRLGVLMRAGLEADEPEIREAESLNRSVGDKLGLPLIHLHRALSALRNGDVSTAARFSSAALAEASASPFAAIAKRAALVVCARVALVSGDLPRASACAYESLVDSYAGGSVDCVTLAMEALARIAARSGSDQDAVRLLGAAKSIRLAHGVVPGVWEQAYLDSDIHELRERLGDEIFETLLREGRALSLDDAVAYATRGRGERKRPSFGWEALTPAERDVSELAAQGLRNKDIAEKLFITPATVKTHLTHVFAKLGVSTRSELAALVAQRERSTTG
jgi:predicted ATPase/class 3 adenylate cyclase/DNA-binding CsgD family transcriptional regulator